MRDLAWHIGQRMREMLQHTPGRIFLAVLLAATLGLIVLVGAGLMAAQANGAPVLLFGWMSLPLAAGMAYVAVLLAAYLVYFFRYWPYR